MSINENPYKYYKLDILMSNLIISKFTTEFEHPYIETKNF